MFKASHHAVWLSLCRLNHAGMQCKSHARVPCRVVHLDLKSSNVLIAGDGSAKISDVGLAALMSQNYLSQMAPAGTWSWVAPEVILGGETFVCTHIPLSMRHVNACLMHDRVGWEVSQRSVLLTVCEVAPDVQIYRQTQLPDNEGLTSSVC